jgi:hypothetical protein
VSQFALKHPQLGKRIVAKQAPMEERGVARAGIFFLGLAVASPSLADSGPSDVATGACYVYSVDRVLHYCRDNTIEKVCYQAARNFKMAGKWSRDETCVDVRYE